MPSGKFVAYYRVSTERQGASGLGLDAQRASVRDWLNGGDWSLVGEFTDVESGKNDTRPQLAAAMHMARMTGATLVIAKIDRLSRNATFLLGLRDAGVEFVAVDMPGANRLTVGIMALVAEQEREAISSRTKAALAVAKARGVVLGGYRGAPAPDAKLGGQAVAAAADAFARQVGPVAAELRGRGLSLAAVAAELQDRGILTARGGTAWTATGVKNLLARLG